MTWFWYSARPDELFIDLDTPDKLPHFERRLQAAMDSDVLPVLNVHKFPSKTNGHTHIVILLRWPLEAVKRFTWEMVLWSDIYRGCCNIMRALHSVPNPDIFITPHSLHRPADDMCECVAKHTAHFMATCPAAIRLRGENRTRGFFGKSNVKK